MWFELSSISGEELVFESGLVYFGDSDSTMLNDVSSALTELGVSHRTYEPAADLGPRLKANERGIFVPEAGWVRADRAWNAIRSRFVELGGRLVDAAVSDLGELKEFDRVVLANGPWITRFVALPVKVHLQTWAYVQTPQAQPGPVWIHDSPELFYGFPSEPGASTIKIGVHRSGPEIDPNNTERVASSTDVAAIENGARERFGVEGAKLDVRTCLYTVREGDDFLLGHLDERTSYISACSGHAFKLAPWLGRLMCKFAFGEDRPENWPRFHFVPSSSQ